MLLSASRYRAQGEDHYYDFGEAGVNGVARGLNGAKADKLFARLRQGPWALDVAWSDSRMDDPTAQYFSDPLAPDQYQRDRYLLSQFQYDEGFADGRWQFSGRLFLGRERYFGRYLYSGAPFMATAAGNWQGVELRLLSIAFTNHKLLMGVEAQDNSRRDQGNADLTSPDPSVDLRIHGSGWRVGGYLQDEWSLGRAFTATLGLRVDDNDVTDAKLSPRAAVIWKATPSTVIKAMYGRAHRSPNAFERDYDDAISQVANPALSSETIETMELVAEQRLGPDLRLRGSVYRWRMQYLVVLGIDPSSGLSQYQSGDTVTATGIEVSADKTWGWGGRVRGSLSYQDATSAGDRLDNSPKLLGKLNVSGPLGAMPLRLGYEIQYASKRRAIDASDLKGYWLSNLSLNLDASAWTMGLELSLGIYNLFDERHEHPGSDINWQRSIEQDGRSVRLMAGWRFR